MKKWHRIAERLCESGWSWNHSKLTDRLGRNVHVAEVHNDEGVMHVAVAKTVGPAFDALEESVRTAK